MKPNILLITIDTVRPDHLGCYGYDQNTSPNIDRLAAEGTVFEQAITNGSYTKTAFPPIFSSTYASMYGGPFSAVGTNRPMLAKLLKDYGYATAGFTANPLLGAHIGYDAGFDDFEEPVPQAESRTWLRIKGVQRLLRTSSFHKTLMLAGIDTQPHQVYVKGDVISDKALQWIGNQKSPFFLWAHYMDAHWPYYRPPALTSAEDRAQAWRDLYESSRSRFAPPDCEFIQRLGKLYDIGLKFMDEQIGQLFDALERQGQWHNTLVILTADHGEAFYEHGRIGHGALFDFTEEILRVPLIIKLPSQEEQRRCQEQVTLLDLVPTVKEVIGLGQDDVTEGKSLLPSLEGKHEIATETAVVEMIDRDWYCAALRTERYKYLYDERLPDRRMLYDLQSERGEAEDIYGRHPELETKLEGYLTAHLARISNSGGRDPNGAWSQQEDVERRLRALGYLE